MYERENTNLESYRPCWTVHQEGAGGQRKWSFGRWTDEVEHNVLSLGHAEFDMSVEMSNRYEFRTQKKRPGLEIRNYIICMERLCEAKKKPGVPRREC